MVDLTMMWIPQGRIGFIFRFDGRGAVRSTHLNITNTGPRPFVKDAARQTSTIRLL